MIVEVFRINSKPSLHLVLNTETNIIRSFSRGCPDVVEEWEDYFSSEEKAVLPKLYYYILNYRSGTKSMCADVDNFKDGIHGLMQMGVHEYAEVCRSGKVYSTYVTAVKRILAYSRLLMDTHEDKVKELKDLAYPCGNDIIVYNSKADAIVSVLDRLVPRDAGFGYDNSGNEIDHNSSFEDYIMGVDPISFNYKDFTECYVRYSVSAFDKDETVRAGFKMYYKQIACDALKRFRDSCNSRRLWRITNKEDRAKFDELLSDVTVKNVRLILTAHEVVVTLCRKQDFD